MRKFPVFVAAGADRVAAVVTAPEEQPPRGVVLLLSGTGRHIAIGSTLSARLSERLAGEGLASVRLDYAGSGDSPGLVARWDPAEIAATTAQARAALDVAREALDVKPFAEVGTCYGSRIALSLVEDPSCTGAVCLAPPILDVGGLGRMSRGVRDGRVGALVRSNATLRRVLAPARRLLGARTPARRVAGAFAHLDRARLVFLYGARNAHEDHYSGRAQKSIDAAVAGLSADERSRFELKMIAGGPLTTFDGLPPEEQEEIVDIVVPFVTSFFETTG
ncbi:MAG TPA: alpha/beta hydrolase [Gaiellaceae bacterium]|nr:alpha/beta hydrolase [Gaiellaceae bacterium]